MLAQLTGTQSAWTCNETFKRFYPENTPNVASILAAGTKWSDPQYTQEIAMRGITTSYTWKRMSDQFTEANGYKLFQNNSVSSIEIDDTIQGYLGDCWVLASIAAIAEKPERVWKIFQTKTYNPAGIYSLRYYELGVPISVVIDEFIPISYSQSLFVKMNSAAVEKEVWPILIEKAFSKLHGTF